MNNIYRIEDEIFTINASTHIKFNTKVTKYDENKSKSFYSEFKTNNRKEASVLSRRKLEYYLTFEYSYLSKNLIYDFFSLT